MAGPVFQLAVYSCVSLMGFDGLLLSKVCRWDLRALYATEALCSAAGDAEIGKPIWSDIAENRTIEQSRCGAVSVLEGVRQ
jgi:hypothetical protein